MSEVIYINAGHGGGGSTAGKRTPDGEYEWNFNNTVVSSAVVHLRHNGFTVVRGDDIQGKKDVPLATRTNLANAKKAKLYISVHMNALAGKWGDHGGTETFYYVGSASSQKIATLVHNETMKIMKLRDRKLKNGNHLWEVSKSHAPACLLEVGFMDSRTDIDKLRNAALLREVGKGIARAVCAYFGKAFKDKDSGATTTVATPKPTPAPKVTAKATEPIGTVKVLVDKLNYYNSPRWANPSGTAKKGTVFTVMEKVKVGDGYQYRLKSGNYITAHTKYVVFTKK